MLNLFKRKKAEVSTSDDNLAQQTAINDMAAALSYSLDPLEVIGKLGHCAEGGEQNGNQLHVWEACKIIKYVLAKWKDQVTRQVTCPNLPDDQTKQLRERLNLLFDEGGWRRKPRWIKEADIILLETWLRQVHDGSFVDDDGHGAFAFHGGRSDSWKLCHAQVYPSDITKLNIQPPKWATHVAWFNK
jgi:hypothetical protein